MKPIQLRRPLRVVLLLAAMVCTSCSRAPSFDILGSFFPAWLLCLAFGLLLTGVAHWRLGQACSKHAIAVSNTTCASGIGLPKPDLPVHPRALAHVFSIEDPYEAYR